MWDVLASRWRDAHILFEHKTLLHSSGVMSQPWLGTACLLPVCGNRPPYTVKAMYLGTIVHHELTHTLNGAPCHLHPNVRDSVALTLWRRGKSFMQVFVLEFKPNRSTHMGWVSFRMKCSLSGNHSWIFHLSSSQPQATWKWEDQESPLQKRLSTQGKWCFSTLLSY